MPAHVEATGPAEGDAPPVPCKPGVLFGRLPQGNRTGTGTEGVEIEFDARGVHEGVSVLAFDGNKPVGMGDQGRSSMKDRTKCLPLKCPSVTWAIIDSLPNSRRRILP